MDWMSLKEKLALFANKYKYVFLILLAGIVLMLIPSKKENQTVQTPTQAVVETEDISSQLQQILSKMSGVGRVEVLLTVASGEKVIYQYDQDISNGETGSSRLDTVIITDSDRSESGLVQQINPPIYQGAIIVCQGADNISVRLNIIEAVAKVTGLGTDRISVLKMK